MSGTFYIVHIIVSTSDWYKKKFYPKLFLYRPITIIIGIKLF